MLKLDLFLQESCKKKFHLPLLKGAFFKGGGGSAEMKLNSLSFALRSKLKALICYDL